jgi:hypothetical protein
MTGEPRAGTRWIERWRLTTLIPDDDPQGVEQRLAKEGNEGLTVPELEGKFDRGYDLGKPLLVHEHEDRAFPDGSPMFAIQDGQHRDAALGAKGCSVVPVYEDFPAYLTSLADSDWARHDKTAAESAAAERASPSKESPGS